MSSIPLSFKIYFKTLHFQSCQKNYFQELSFSICFSLISFFNDISPFVGYLMPVSFSLEEQWYNLFHGWGDKWVHTFTNGIIFTNPSIRAGYDTRSIFKRSYQCYMCKSERNSPTEVRTRSLQLLAAPFFNPYPTRTHSSFPFSKVIFLNVFNTGCEGGKV